MNIEKVYKYKKVFLTVNDKKIFFFIFGENLSYFPRPSLTGHIFFSKKLQTSASLRLMVFGILFAPSIFFALNCAY